MSARIVRLGLVVAVLASAAGCEGLLSTPPRTPRPTATPQVSGSPSASALPGATASPGALPPGAGASPAFPHPTGVTPAPSQPGVQPTLRPRPSPPPPTPERPVAGSASVSPACVVPTSSATLTVNTEPHTLIGADVYWADGSKGESKVDHADSNGTFTWSFLVTVGTPPGTAKILIGMSAFDGGYGTTEATFLVQPEHGTC